MASDSLKSTSSTQPSNGLAGHRDIEKGVPDGLRKDDQRESPDDLEQTSKAAGAEPQAGSNEDADKGPSENGLAHATTHDPAYEVSFDGLSDPMHPRGRYSTLQKWVFVIICSSTSFCVTCASSLYTMTYEQLEDEFGCSEEVATLGLSLFVIGLGLGPMLLGPLSEVCWNATMLKALSGLTPV